MHDRATLWFSKGRHQRQSLTLFWAKTLKARMDLPAKRLLEVM